MEKIFLRIKSYTSTYKIRELYSTYVTVFEVVPVNEEALESTTIISSSSLATDIDGTDVRSSLSLRIAK